MRDPDSKDKEESNNGRHLSQPLASTCVYVYAHAHTHTMGDRGEGVGHTVLSTNTDLVFEFSSL